MKLCLPASFPGGDFYAVIMQPPRHAQPRGVIHDIHWMTRNRSGSFTPGHYAAKFDVVAQLDWHTIDIAEPDM
jgi:hypothetical protein